MPRSAAHCRSRSYLHACRILLPAVGALVLSQPVFATHTWNDGTGAWSVASNWSPATLPGLNENIFLNSNDGVARTITYDSNVTNVQLGALNVDLTGAGSNSETLAITSGTLTTTTQDIGIAGRGAVTQSGGSNNAAALILGDQAGSIGNYTMTFGALNVSGDETIGKSGTGTLTMSGNAGNTVAGNLSIGAAVGGNGTITLSGNQPLNAANIFIGGSSTGAGGKGVVNLTSGSLVASGSLTIYNTPGSALNLSGGILNVGFINLLNPAGFQFTGGSIRLVNQPIDIGTSTVPDGALNLQNNTTLNNFQILNSVNYWVWLRSAGSTLTQNPGSSVFSPNLYIGNQTGAGANAVYTLNGGNLNISQFEFIGYVGTGGVGGGGATFNQYAGNNTVPVMFLGNNGPATYNQFDGNVTLNSNLQIAPNFSPVTYNMSGGLVTSPAVYVGGGTAAGTLNISGSANMTVSGTLTIYNSVGTSLNLSGGSLTAGNISFSGNRSFFHWTGGSLHLTNQPLPFTNSGDPNALFGNSLSVSVGQSLIVDQGEMLNTAGSSITQSGGLNAPLVLIISTDSGVGPTASYTMTGGNLDVHVAIIDVGFNNPGTLTISGGSAIAHQLITGNGGTFNLSGTAIFTAVVNELLVSNNSTINQTGGTNNIGSSIEFGSPLPSTYNFSGGAIVGTDYISIGGSDTGDTGLGTFNMSGNASITIPNALVIRPANGNLFNFNGGNISAGALNFNGNPANFVWTAGTLNINSSVTWDPNAGPTSTSSALGFSLTLGAGKTLAISGDETLGGNGDFFLTLNSGGNHSVGGNLSLSGNGLLTLNSGGALSASGLNFNGNPANFIWNAGTLTLTNDVTWDSAASPTSTSAAFNSALTLNSGRTLAISGGETIGGTGPFTLTLNSGSAHNVLGYLTLAPGGTLVNNNAVLTYSTLVQSGGTIGSNANSTFDNRSNFVFNSGTFNGQFINDGTTAINGFFSPSNGFQNNGLIYISGSNATLNVTNGLFFNPLGTIQFNGGFAIFNTGSPLNLFGQITGFGQLYAPGGINNQAHVTVANGTLWLDPGSSFFSNSGQIDLAPGTTFQVLTFATCTNSGFINLNGGSLSLYGMNNTPSGAISGNGTIFGNGNFTNAGLLEVDAGLLTVFGLIANTGTIQLGGNTAVLSAAFPNSGTIQGAGRVTGAVTSNGTIEAIAGTLTFPNSLTNTGTLRTTPGSKLLLQNFPTNTGLIDLAGGTLDTNNQPLTNNGTIAGFGILSTGGGGLTNNGIFTVTAGSATINGNVTNNAGKTILVKNTPALFTGNITNLGTIKITSTTVTFTGNYTGNQYISDPATNIFQANATVTPGGLMTGGPGDAFLFNTFTNNGTFTNGGNLTVSTAITNTATFTQSGPQSWLPGATFTNQRGTATFSSNAKLYALTITAGTVDITTSKFIIETTVANKPATLAALQQNIAAHALIATTIPANYALALIDNALLNKPSFGNNPADTNSLLLAPELLGDTNIDGTVNLLDLQTVLNHFGQQSPNWTDGNFDHTSTINLTDLAFVLNNFGQTNPTPTSSGLQITDYGLPTPEPTTLTLLLPATLFLQKRRRRI